MKPQGPLRKVRLLANPRSGSGLPSDSLWEIVENAWAGPGIDVSYQFSNNVEDGRQKAARAVADGVDTVLVAGGDGMVNSIGGALVGTSVALGVVPTGSGNGFARHFGIPLEVDAAVRALRRARRRSIDVGTANGRAFFVTCGLAWDAAIAQRFATFPFRGIAPYVFAAAAELIAYENQPIEASLDGGRPHTFPDPIICTVANLTQFGGGAQIAPKARPDDGFMEMVVVRRQDLPLLLVNLPRLFNGTLDLMPQVLTRRFRHALLRRRAATPIQMDGELVPAGREVDIRLLPKALDVLVPAPGDAA